MLRYLVCGLACFVACACTKVDDLTEAPVYLGNFHLAHNVVVAPNLKQGPLSREASKAAWVAAMKDAVDERFSRYNGTRLYHLGISLEAYVLAKGGIPVVAAPKSALLLKVTAWDDEKQARLNDEPELITVVENLTGDSIVGSGLFQTGDEQMEALARKAAKLIENWLVRQNNTEGWFEDDGVPAGRKPQGRAAQARLEAEADEEAQLQQAVKDRIEATEVEG